MRSGVKHVLGGGGQGGNPQTACSALAPALPGKGVLDPGLGLWTLSSLPALMLSWNCGG